MKVATVALLVLATLLAVTSAERQVGNYNAIVKADERPSMFPSMSVFRRQEYRLEDETPSLPAVPGAPEVKPQRVCLVVRCFPRGSRIQICRCIVWRK